MRTDWGSFGAFRIFGAPGSIFACKNARRARLPGLWVINGGNGSASAARQKRLCRAAIHGKACGPISLC